jgi:hypothetical protein
LNWNSYYLPLLGFSIRLLLPLKESNQVKENLLSYSILKHLLTMAELRVLKKPIPKQSV